jgi:hypothetical protein
MLRADHDSLVEAPYCPPNLDTTKVKNLKDRAGKREKKERGGREREREEREGLALLAGHQRQGS